VGLLLLLLLFCHTSLLCWIICFSDFEAISVHYRQRHAQDWSIAVSTRCLNLGHVATSSVHGWATESQLLGFVARCVMDIILLTAFPCYIHVSDGVGDEVSDGRAWKREWRKAESAALAGQARRRSGFVRPAGKSTRGQNQWLEAVQGPNSYDTDVINCFYVGSHNQYQQKLGHKQAHCTIF